MNLLESLGLSPSSGYDFTLPDDVRQQIANQPQGGVLQSPLLQGVAAGSLGGDNGQGGSNTADTTLNAQGAGTTNTAIGGTDTTAGDTNTTGSDSNPSYDSTPSLLSSVAAGDKSQSQSPDNSDNSSGTQTANTGSDANPSYLNAAGAESDNASQGSSGIPSSPSAANTASNANAGSNAVGNASDNTNGDTNGSANANAATTGTTVSGDSGDSGNTDTSTAPQSGFLSRLMHGLTNMSPEASQAVLSAGLGMLAHSQGAGAGWSSIGEGAQQGMQTYMTIKQQEIANALAQQKLAQENALNQSTIAKNAADSGATTLNARTEAFKAAHPNAQIIDNGGSTQLYDPVSKTYSPAIPKSLAPTVTTTAPGSTTSVVGGTGGTNGGPSATPVVSGGVPTEVKVSANKAAQEASSQAATSAQQAQVLDQTIKYINSPAGLAEMGSSGGIPGTITKAMAAAGITTSPLAIINNQMTADSVRQSFAAAGMSGQRLDRAVQSVLVNGSPNFSAMTPDQKTMFLTYERNQASAQAKTASNTATWQNYAGANGDGSVATHDYKDSNGNTVIAAGTKMQDFIANGVKPSSIGGAASAATPATPTMNRQWAATATPQQQAQVTQIIQSGNKQAIATLKSKGII